MLLGLDFLTSQKANIQFLENTLSFGLGKNRITIKINTKLENEDQNEQIELFKTFVRMKKDCKIPPKSSVICNLTMEKNCKNINIDCLPYYESYSGVGVRKKSTTENNIKLELYKYTNVEKTLHKNQRICSLVENNTTHDIATNINFANLEKEKIEKIDLNELKDKEGKKIDVNPNLKPKQKSQVGNLIKKHIDLFTSDPLNVGVANVEPYKINMTNTTPVASRAYKLSPPERREMKKLIDKMVKAGILQRSSSEYATPVFLKRKADGTFRFLCNFQKLNQNVAIDRNAVPRTDNIFMAMEGKNYFCTLDAN